MNSQPSVTLFSTPTCSWCRVVKDYFRKNGISYRDIDVSRDQKAAEDMYRRTGQLGVPVILVNNQAVVGFNKSRLDSLLGIKPS